MAHSGYHPLYDGPLFESADGTFFDFDAREGSGSQPGTGSPVFDTPQINVTSDYNRAIAFMDCATAQYSDSSHGHHNTGESLLARNTEANFEYTVTSLDEGPAQAVAEFQTFETVATFPAVQGRTAADFGLTFNSQVTHNSSCTWQPAGSHEEYPTDSSSGYIATPGLTEVTDIEEGHHHTGIHQPSSICTAYDGPPKYSTQIDSDLAGLSLHPSASDMVDPQGGMLSPLLQDGPTMERSFPPYMYTAKSNLLGGLDTHLIGSPISVYVSCHSAIESLAGEQELHSNVPSRPSSYRSHRLSVSDGPSSPTPTITPDFVETLLSCGNSGCKETFTGRFRRGNLARHIRIVHNQTQYPCGGRGCIKTFKRSDARLKHQRKKHPELGLLQPSTRR